TTSITNDANGALGSRQAVWGATYPFSPRYADRYMPEDPTSTYITRSYQFGGPWHFMNKLVDMDPDAQAFALREIGIYKAIRGAISAGQVFHVSVAPANGYIDAIESYSSTSDSSVTIVVRDNGDESLSTVKLQGHAPDRTFLVHFQDDSRVLTMTGRQLASTG